MLWVTPQTGTLFGVTQLSPQRSTGSPGVSLVVALLPLFTIFAASESKTGGGCAELPSSPCPDPTATRPCSHCSAAVNLSYQPHLTRANLGGRVTGSTFVLEQPRCVFDEYNTSEIWLVVATSAGEWGDGGMGLYWSAPLHYHPHPRRQE